MREYMKEKLNNIFRWLEIFIYSLKRSRVWENRLADGCGYWKGLQNMDQLENTKEKSLGGASLLTLTT